MTKASFVDLTIQLDDAVGTPQDISAYVTSINGWSKERIIEEVTAAGDADDAWAGIGFLQKSEIVLTGSYDDTEDGLIELCEAWDDDTERTLTLTFVSGTTATVECLLKQTQINPSRGVFHAYIATLRPTGAIT